MYHNPIVQDNLQKLEKFGYEIIPPDTGMLANGDMGDGKLPSEEVLVEYVVRELAREKDLAGKRVLVTAGPTQEALDPVRFLTNHSTGKMGYALAKCAMLRGAQVTLVTGVTAFDPPMFIHVVPVVTAEEMYHAVIEYAPWADIIIKAAAVADYRPAETAKDKIKKKDGEASILLERTRDILGELGHRKSRGELKAFLCGFSMETQNLEENSKEKLRKKHLDMVAANNLKVEGAGFGTDTNVITLLTKSKVRNLEKMGKEEAADQILDVIQEEMKKSKSEKLENC